MKINEGRQIFAIDFYDRIYFFLLRKGWRRGEKGLI